MDFILEGGFEVKPGLAKDFQHWWEDMEPRVRGACPQGVELLGVFVVAFSSEKHAGSYRILWRVDSYSALDRMGAANATTTPFGDFARKLADFVDGDPRSCWSHSLYRRFNRTQVYF